MIRVFSATVYEAGTAVAAVVGGCLGALVFIAFSAVVLIFIL